VLKIIWDLKRNPATVTGVLSATAETLKSKDLFRLRNKQSVASAIRKGQRTGHY